MKKKERVEIKFTHHADGRLETYVNYQRKDGSFSLIKYPVQDITVEEAMLSVLEELFPKIRFIIEEEYIDEDDTDE